MSQMPLIVALKVSVGDARVAPWKRVILMRPWVLFSISLAKYCAGLALAGCWAGPGMLKVKFMVLAQANLGIYLGEFAAEL